MNSDKTSTCLPGSQIAVYLAMIAITVFVFIANISINGPMIQADEGSYLANAAAIAGHLNDFASSYSAGYSILISPAFIIGGEPSTVWLYVKTINAILYLFLSLGIWKLANTSILGDPPRHIRIISTAIVLLYPMWTIMVGYSFSQIAFVCVFVWSVYFLQTASEAHSKQLFCIFSILSGFLYWIHPTGFAVIAAGTAAALIHSIKTRDIFYIALYATASVAAILLYKYGFQPWLIERMTLGGAPSLHYPSIINLLTPLSSFAGLSDVAGRTAGHIFYLTVGTLGLFWIGISESFKRSDFAVKRSKKRDSEHLDGTTHSFMLLCLVGLVFLSVLLFSSTPEATRLDHWMYGRYVEGVIAPILLIGSAFFSRRKTIQSAYVAVLAATLLFFSINEYSHTARFNVSTFWQDFYIRDLGLFWWAACGVLLILTIAATGKKLGHFLIACFFVFCAYLQISWHERASAAASNRWEASAFIRDNLEPGTCIGFDHSGIDSRNKHVFWFDFGFQLYDYRLRRLSPEKWVDNECEGPLFSYNPNIDTDYGVEAHVAAVSPHGGPLLWKKGRTELDAYPFSISTPSPALPSILKTGWHSIEAKHVWSGSRAHLSLPVPEQCKLSSCFVDINFSIYGASLKRPAEVIFISSHSNQYEHRGSYTAQGPFTARIRLVSELTHNEIAVFAPNAISPAKLGKSSDERDLGIALHSISLNVE